MTAERELAPQDELIVLAAISARNPPDDVQRYLDTLSTAALRDLFQVAVDLVGSVGVALARQERR